MLGWIMSYKSLYLVDTSLEMVLFFTGMRKGLCYSNLAS